ncbi:MAG: right-handed parallel beta-helix repeat-containing protein [Thermoplasmatales archaeon]|nr:right-handed parallel beta-helix repeat-containing protein [Thermoplasmatales archaeon]
MKHIIPILVILLLLSSGFVGVSSQTFSEDVITVDDEGDGDYTSIKEAVNIANPGDIIEVYSGTYNEHGIEILKDNITLVGIPYELGTGSDTGKPFLDGKGHSLLLIWGVDGVTLSGFRIENEGNVAAGTITLNSATNCLISENDVSHMLTSAIYCWNCSNIQIINNNLSHSAIRQGIVVTKSNNNEISGNTISDMDLEGILLKGSHHNLISYNRVSRCSWVGITIIGDRNIIYRNHIEDNDNGLEIWNGIFNFVIQNNFINNSYDAHCALGWGFYPAFSNRWINNYWDDWNGIGPKVISGTILFFIPRPNFDWRPAQEPHDI